MKKVLLIGDSPIGDSPYIQSYIEILEQNSIPYDLLFWNRHLDSTEQLPENFIPYNLFTDNNYPSWKRLYNIWKFSCFASRWMRKKEYAYVVVFTIAHAVFMYRTLISRYNGRYIFDIRDYSPMCKVKMLYKVIDKLIRYSAYTVISSAGFMRWLPKCEKYRYIVAQNTTKEMIDKYIDNQEFAHPSRQYTLNNVISILTVGQIRDFEANSYLMQCLNHPQFRLFFAGSGLASNALKEYSEQNHINNAIFTGRYLKADEENIVMPHQMINSYLGSDVNSDTLMSNRFYLSVLLRKPIIVNSGSFQADVVEKYGLGIVLKPNDYFADRIVEYWNSLDWKWYNSNCERFLNDILKEINQFENILTSLYKKQYNGD